MQLTELIQLVLLRSGQIIVDDLSELHLSKEKFLLIVQNELVKYNKYCPYKKRYTIVTTEDKPHVFKEEDGIPRWISEVVPVSGANSSYDIFNRKFFYSSYGEELHNPTLLLWRYDRPNLSMSSIGDFECIGHLDHPIIKKDEIDETYFPTLSASQDEILIDLITAQFMITLGRSRRAYKLDQIPLITDDSELISDGTALYEQAYQRLLDNSSWVYAFGA